MLEKEISELLRAGTVIPAHPLALTEGLTIDEHYQRLLTQYYIKSGAGGIAVGVHTTQFEIRNKEFNLLEPVFRMAAEEIERIAPDRPFIKVAGICGPTAQAVEEAKLAKKYGYYLGLLSMGGLNHLSEAELLERTRTIAEIIPVFGFYLQPAVGGRALSYDFWLQFANIHNVHAIKVAPFNRYLTLDVVRAVCNSKRCDDITLYTGNDDNIIMDLLTPYRINVGDKIVEKRFAGGLLGHWAVWTKVAVDLLQEIKQCIKNDYKGIEELLQKNIAITDMNAVIFDAAHNFHGCIPGIHEVLYRQGLLKHTRCLNPEEKLSSGQDKEIDRIYAEYPDLTDDDFVKSVIL